MQGNSEFKKLQHGPPPYLSMLHQIFEGIVVDGSTAYVPGASDVDEQNYNEVEEEEEEVEFFEVPQEPSPMTSSGHKRSGSTSTTGKSPSKKSKSPIVHCINNFLSESTKTAEKRTNLMQHRAELQLEAMNKEKAQKKAEVHRAKQMTLQDGVTGGSTEYYALAYIVKDDELRTFYLDIPTAEQRVLFIRRFCADYNLK